MLAYEQRKRLRPAAEFMALFDSWWSGTPVTLPPLQPPTRCTPGTYELLSGRPRCIPV